MAESAFDFIRKEFPFFTLHSEQELKDMKPNEQIEYLKSLESLTKSILSKKMELKVQFEAKKQEAERILEEIKEKYSVSSREELDKLIEKDWDSFMQSHKTLKDFLESGDKNDDGGNSSEGGEPPTV
jgi:hypothetical protein